MDYLSALVLGLVGSLHCAGMCGPIALALPLNNESWFSRVSGGLLYNGGRIITYGLLGAIFGLAGMGIALGGLQQYASIALGVIMILAVIIPRLGKAGSWVNRVTDRFTRIFSKPLARLFRVRSYRSLFFIGFLNGFLPCGLVYIALAGALVTGKYYEGAIYMVLFGLGTIPMLLAISLAGNFLTQQLRRQLSRIIPAVIIILGILFILRGLNLGIPYVSPKLDKKDGKEVMECCHPEKS